jgi:anionic cell wall polymer biosynthesis LytR-Cps2A-Psr (LCP) family protein
MDGDLALWYSRTRRLTGGDFDRSRQHRCQAI